MKLKTNKPKTFADVAKPIQNLIEKAKSRPASQARDNTIMLLEKQLDDLFAKQEAIKEAQNPQPQMPMQPEGLPMEQPEMAYGGYLHKYFGGGDTDPFKNPPQEEITKPVDFVRNQNNQAIAEPFIFSPYVSRVNPPIMNTITNKGSQPLPIGSFQPKASPLPMPNLPDLKPTPEASYIPTPFIQAGGYKNPYDYNYMTLDDKAVQAEQERVRKLNSANTPSNTSSNTKPIQGFNRWGEVGALASGLASTFRQNRNINNVDRPDLLNNVYFSAGAAPDKVDYSAELNALNSDIGAAREGLRLGGGNTSTMMSNIGALRAQQLQRRGQIMQGQENANTELMNNYKARQAEAGMKSQLTNAGIAQENMANEFGYNQWLAKQRNAAIANETQLSNDVFNNMTKEKNQLAAAGIMANANPSTVIRDMIKGNKKLADAMLAEGKISKQEYNQALGLAYGGIKYAEGGSVYKQKLQDVLKDKTVDRAAQMDAEYEQALKDKKSTFKSNVTGLEYKVLPRGEKDLYAAQLWKDALGTAPTKSQKEATKKALEGKSTSSTKAKEVASFSTKPPVNSSTKDLDYINSRIKDGKFTSPATNTDDMIKDHLRFQQEMQKPKAEERYDLSKGVSEWKSNVTNQPKTQTNQSGPWPQQPWQNPNREVVIKGDRITKPAPTNVEKLKLKPQAEQPSGPWPQKAWANPNREVVVNAERVRKPVNRPEADIQNMPSDNTKATPMELAQVKKKPSFNPNAFGLATSNAVSPDYVGRGKEAISRFNSEVKDLKDKAKLDVTAGARMVTKTAADVGGEGFKQVVPTSIRALGKDVINNNFGTKSTITEKDFTKTEQEEIKKLAAKKLKENKTKGASKAINSYNDYEEGANSLTSQWSDNKNIRNTLGKFNPVQDGDTLRIKDTYNFNEKDNNKVIKTYGKWVSHWKEKGYPSALAYVRSVGSRWGSAGSETGDDTKGTKVNIKLYNPKRKKA